MSENRDPSKVLDQQASRVLTEDEMIPKTSFAPLAYPEKIHGRKCEDVAWLKSHPQAMAEDLMRIFLSIRTVPILWGPVGAAKTRTIQSLAKESDENGCPYQVITVQPSTEDPTVIHGLMTVVYNAVDQTQETVRSIPEVPKRVYDYYKTFRGLTILFLDEMTTCLPAQQNALLGLLSHGTYGTMDISPYVSQVVAANPEGTVSTVVPLSQALLNRCAHIAWYGDVDIWFDAWKEGFGKASQIPKDQTIWFARMFIEKKRAEMFRSPDGSWTPDDLTPQEDMQNTPRSFTEVLKAYEKVNDIFKDSPDEVRHYYIEAITEATIGRREVATVREINAVESERISPENIVRMVNKAEVKPSWSNEQLREALGDSLYLHNRKIMHTDRLRQTYEQLFDLIYDGVNFNPDAYLAIMALVSTYPENSMITIAAEYGVKTLEVGVKMMQLDRLPRDEVRPRFVPQTVLDVIRTLAGK